MTQLAHHVSPVVQDERLLPLVLELRRDASEAIVAFNKRRQKHYTFAITAPGVEPGRRYRDWRVSHLRVEPDDHLVDSLGLLLPHMGAARILFTNLRLVRGDAGFICAYDILIEGNKPMQN